MQTFAFLITTKYEVTIPLLLIPTSQNVKILFYFLFYSTPDLFSTINYSSLLKI